MESIIVNGEDLENWSLEELIDAVAEFTKRENKVEQEAPNYEYEEIKEIPPSENPIEVIFIKDFIGSTNANTQISNNERFAYYSDS